MTELDHPAPAPVTSYRSSLPPGRAGFAQLLHAEFTKFRTVRGWVYGVVGATVFMVLISLAGGHAGGNCVNGVCSAGPSDPVYTPAGIPVTDGFYFVHQTLDGDGSLTVRIASMTDTLAPAGPHEPAPDPGSQETWGKAGIILKTSLTPGSSYAAVLATSGHGVRMQYDYTHDIAGSAAAVTQQNPRWFRLTRTGDAVTGYESPDGTTWTELGTADLPGLGTSVQAGLFAASPEYSQNTQMLGGLESSAYNSTASARIDHVALTGHWPDAAWTGTSFDYGTGSYTTETSDADATAYLVSGSGDIAPGADLQDTSQLAESGAFLALIALTVLATQFVTAEFKHRILAPTLAASPRRGRLLAAKSLVVAAVAFAVGLIASAIAVPLFDRMWPAGALYPVGAATHARVIIGISLLLALCAVLAVAVGMIFRRSAVVIAAVLVLMVLPYLLAIGSLLPGGAADWLLRVTPAAAFAIAQTIPVYPQVDNIYQPYAGYYPLAPWAGLSVLAAYTAVALGIAWLVLRRRDVTA